MHSCVTYLMLACLVSTGISINFNNFRYDFLKVPDILATYCRSEGEPKLLIPVFNSLKFDGLYVNLKYCFREPHVFSMGLRCGDLMVSSTS